MLRGDEIIFIWVGALFIFLGLIGLLAGQIEDKIYEYALSRRFDLREFVERLPRWPEPGALKIGGLISLGLGMVLLGIGLVNYLELSL